MVKKLVWDNALVDQFWSRVAETELNDISFARLNGQALIDKVACFIPDQAVCLDFGAGEGHLTSLLLQMGCKVSVFEPSSGRVAQIMQQPFAQNENFQDVVTGESIANNAGRFDVILASEVIEHVLEDDLPAFSSAIKSMLKPGGVVIITTPNNEYLPHNEAICPTCQHSFHRWQHVRSFTAASLEQFFADLNIRCLRLFETDFSNVKDIMARNAELEQAIKGFQKFGPLYYPLYKWRQAKAAKQLETATYIREGVANQLIFVGRNADDAV